MADSREAPWKGRFAKVQVREDDLPSLLPAQTGLSFNIWYNKWSQGQGSGSRFVNPYRLDADQDSGLTQGEQEGEVFFCVYFSKGMCCMGKRCRYLHHIPDEEDVAKLAMKSDVLDCFGREKFSDYRDDMGGVGSFRRKNRTLYVGGILGGLNNKVLKAAQIEGRIRYVFSQLGKIDRIRYVEDKNCAFVKFKYQVNAEFAKECMSNQTLLIPSDKEWDQRKEGTGLLVKWARDDPNPAARKLEEEEQKKESFRVMVQLLEKQEQNMNKRAVDIEPQETEEGHLQGIISEELIFKLKKRKRTAVGSSNAVPESKRTKPRPLVEYPSSEED
ncbi:active spliceosome conformation promoter CWC2 Ecym_1394 [Eremothecium cymbalariae DBVPG|uniref:Pre-mRNA-splicing factor CWC2 n=1 Tax=Eremothecium cymbalariae (strain CBS 270.75 / DBVPG 7215 / KCTC 17166 / NRRL Y-17582) TaxID=931890 RepID=G8JM53_ERECY|nr:hypothetical protein Ecym_1394 [Eremothecium cymbalariae DBVPG\